MKKLASSIAVIVLMLTMFSIPTYAAQTIESPVATWENEGIVAVEISEEEYLCRMADSENISYQEAAFKNQQVNQLLEARQNDNVLRDARYCSTTRQFTHPLNSSFVAESGATVRLDGAGSMWQISSVTSVTSRGIAGSHSWNWMQLDTWWDGTFPSRSVTIGGSGYFRVAIDSSVAATFSIPGFSMGATVGNTTYFDSTTLRMEWTLNA